MSKIDITKYKMTNLIIFLFDNYTLNENSKTDDYTDNPLMLENKILLDV